MKKEKINAKELIAKFDAIPTQETTQRITIDENSMCSIIRWMGQNGFDYVSAKNALESYGFRPAQRTIRRGLWRGKNSAKYGEKYYVADLPKDIQSEFLKFKIVSVSAVA